MPVGGLLTGADQPGAGASPAREDPTIPVSAIQALQASKLHAPGPRPTATCSVSPGSGWACRARRCGDGSVGPRSLSARPGKAASGTQAPAGHCMPTRCAMSDRARSRWLRREDATSDRQGVQLRAYANMVDDLRAGTTLEQRPSPEALGRWSSPRSSSVPRPTSHSTRATCGGRSTLALVQHYGGQSATRHVNLRIAMHEGAHEQVEEIASALLRGVRRPGCHRRVGHARIAQGAEEALSMTGTEAGPRGNASLLVAEARARRPSVLLEATSLLDFVRARHPRDRDAQALFTSLTLSDGCDSTRHVLPPPHSRGDTHAFPPASCSGSDSPSPSRPAPRRTTTIYR